MSKASDQDIQRQTRAEGREIQRADGDGYTMVDPQIADCLERIKALETQLATILTRLKQLETEQAIQSEALASLEETY